MSWNANNRAHACLWTFEIWKHDQRDAGFDEVGAWGMSFVTKSAAGASSEKRTEAAMFHARELDEAFTALYRASYEPGIDREGAINAMSQIMIKSDKTISDLADVVDAQYRFIGEVV